MAAYNKFQDFVDQLGQGIHQLHAAGHTLEIFGSNEQPLVGDTVKTDIAEISIENGYPGGTDIENTYTESGGTGTLGGTDKVWTATAGGFGPLQFVPLFNEDAASPLDALVAWWEYTSSVTVNDGETFTFDIVTNLFTLS